VLPRWPTRPCRRRDVEAILDAPCLGRDVQLAEIAVMKLDTRAKLQNVRSFFDPPPI
jgi:hypothetical protein